MRVEELSGKMGFLEMMDQLLADGDIMPPTEKKEDNETCPICKGEKGKFFVDEQGYGVWKPCECWYRERKEKILKFANIPDKYKGARFSNYETDIYQNAAAMRKLKKLCEAYVNEFKESNKGLYIYSETKGSGKTRMACTIANELMKKNVGVKFSTMGTILEKLKDSWNDESEYTESKLKDELKSVDVLIIDDFGVDKSTEWVNNQVYDIINSRYNDKKTTIYTSNTSMSNAKYDSRILSRITETCYPIGWANESIRDKAMKNNSEELKNKYKEI